MENLKNDKRVYPGVVPTLMWLTALAGMVMVGYCSNRQTAAELPLNEKKIEEVLNKADELKKLTNQKQKVSNSLDKRTEVLKREVITYRTHYDTLNLVRTLDSLVFVQDTQIVVLKQISGTKDSIIYLQDKSIGLLKEDNETLKKQVKKSKRRERLAYIVGGVIGAGGIIVGAVK